MEAKKSCSFGSACYRRNPEHLKDYRHEHRKYLNCTICRNHSLIQDFSLVDSILGASTSPGNYTIPEDLKSSHEIISEQLNIMQSFSKEDPPPAKVQAAAAPQSMADFFEERKRRFREREAADAISKQPKHPAGPYCMSEKLRLSAPYNIFKTRVASAPETHRNHDFISFPELLDPSLGELSSTLHINCLIQIDWLLEQYEQVAGCSRLPMLLLYAQDDDALRSINRRMPNITSINVRVPFPVGCQHTKLSILTYKCGGIRVIVSTANLYADDWKNRTQGLWVSNKLPLLGEESTDSVTCFRQDLIEYLKTYNLPALQTTIDRISECDFSSVNCFLVASTPLKANLRHGDIPYGHPRVASLLRQHCAAIDDSCAIICQSSTIGSMGPKPESYLLGEIAKSFKVDGGAAADVRSIPPVKLIFPSVRNVIGSHDGINGGGCLLYGKELDQRQQWLRNGFLCQWQDRAVSHIKSYMRYSPLNGVYWFLLTSANLSKSAWGSSYRGEFSINSYECGVLFLPRLVLGMEFDCFPLKAELGRVRPFPVPFQLPPLQYEANDIPYTHEYLHEHLRNFNR